VIDSGWFWWWVFFVLFWYPPFLCPSSSGNSSWEDVRQRRCPRRLWEVVARALLPLPITRCWWRLSHARRGCFCTYGVARLVDFREFLDARGRPPIMAVHSHTRCGCTCCLRNIIIMDCMIENSSPWVRQTDRSRSCVVMYWYRLLIESNDTRLLSLAFFVSMNYCFLSQTLL